MNKFRILLFIVASLAAVSCSSSASNVPAVQQQPAAPAAPVADTGTVRVEEPAPSELEPSADPKADLEKLNERFAAVKSFRARMYTESTPPVTTEVDFAAPAIYHVKTSTNSLEMVIVGRATYMKVGEEWKMMELPVDPNVAEIRMPFAPALMQWMKDIKSAGEDAAQGRAAYVYTFRGRSPNGAGEANSKLWVAKSDGMPLRIETVPVAANAPRRTVDYDYTTQVNIQVPTQARRANSGYNQPGR